MILIYAVIHGAEKRMTELTLIVAGTVNVIINSSGIQ